MSPNLSTLSYKCTLQPRPIKPQVFCVSKSFHSFGLREARSKGLPHLQWGCQCHRFEVRIYNVDKFSLNTILLRLKFIFIKLIKVLLRFSMTSMDLTTIKNRPQPFLQVNPIRKRKSRNVCASICV